VHNIMLKEAFRVFKTVYSWQFRALLAPSTNVNPDYAYVFCGYFDYLEYLPLRFTIAS